MAVPNTHPTLASDSPPSWTHHPTHPGPGRPLEVWSRPGFFQSARILPAGLQEVQKRGIGKAIVNEGPAPRCGQHARLPKDTQVEGGEGLGQPGPLQDLGHGALTV